MRHGAGTFRNQTVLHVLRLNIWILTIHILVSAFVVQSLQSCGPFLLSSRTWIGTCSQVCRCTSHQGLYQDSSRVTDSRNSLFSHIPSLWWTCRRTTHVTKKIWSVWGCTQVICIWIMWRFRLWLLRSTREGRDCINHRPRWMMLLSLVHIYKATKMIDSNR